MIELAQIARQYRNAFTQKYATQMKGVHQSSTQTNHGVPYATSRGNVVSL
jgi:hypothetical protein